MVNFSAEKKLNHLTRLFIPPEYFFDNEVIGNKEEAHYLKNVLRGSVGDKVIVLDGQGQEYVGIIENITKKEVKIKIIEKIYENREPLTNIVLAQGLCKKDKWELIIQKVTELGVNIIQPFYSDHGVINHDSDKDLQKKFSRWEKIIKNAAEQSSRQRLPDINEPLEFLEVIERYFQAELKIILNEHENKNSIYNVMENYSREVNNKNNNIVIVTGPEGGFSHKEIERAKEYGFISTGLGPRILRTETAAIVAVGLALYQLGEMGGNSFEKDS